MDMLAQRLDQRARTEGKKLPADTIAELLAEINGRFYKGSTARQWLRDQKPLTKALTWPATWLATRAITLPLDRYEAILRGILDTITEHGETAAIRYFPVYFEHCVRLWFAHHGEEVYEERKHIRNAIDIAALTRAATRPTQPDPMETLAQVNRVLMSGRKRQKTASKEGFQGSLFDV